MNSNDGTLAAPSDTVARKSSDTVAKNIERHCSKNIDRHCSRKSGVTVAVILQQGNVAVSVHRKKKDLELVLLVIYY